MSRYNAFIFDLNGTMIDDMSYHEDAWYQVLVNEMKAPYTKEQLKKEMYGKNSEVFNRVFGPGKLSAEQMDEIGMRKERLYQEAFRAHLQLIDGLQDFLVAAKRAHIRLAIGTAAITFNVDYALDNLRIREFFPVIVGPEDVKDSKPDPEVFLKAAERLGVPPEECVVFEDAPKGIEAAKRGGMKAVGITSYHTAKELDNENMLFAVKDYTDERLKELFDPA